MECIEDQLHFELPEGWLWCRLSQIITLHSGQDLEPSRYNDVGIGIPYITGASNLENGKVIINRWTDSPTTHATTGDLLITCKGSGVGKMAWCNICDAHIARQIMALRCLEGLYSDYLEIVISAMLTNIKSKANGLIPGLSRDIILGIMFPLPPFEEQKLICSKCREVLSYIDNIDNQKTDLVDIINVIKSRILDFAIRGKLVPQNPDDEPAAVLLERIRAEKEELIRQGKIKRDKKESIIFKGEDNSYYRNYENESVCIDENIPFEIPSNWEWCNLSMIGSTNIGLTYKPEDIIENGTMVLRSSNIVNGKIDLSDLVRVKTSIRDNQYIEENDILICARNGSKALVGKCAIFSGISERASFGAFMAVYRTAFFKYVYYFLNSNTFRSTFNSDDTKQINQLTQDMIKNSLIPLPPFEEQLRIVETIENVFAQLETIAESLN